MKYIIAIATPLIVLGGCSGGSGVTMQPGEWDMTTEMTDIEVPGMPPEMQAQMRAQLANQAQTRSTCITEEEAGEPMQSMFADSEMAGNCDFGDSSYEGGVIAINATCEGPDGQGTAEMTIEGSYTATTLEADLSVSLSGGPMDAVMSGEMRGERTGDCAADSD